MWSKLVESPDVVTLIDGKPMLTDRGKYEFCDLLQCLHGHMDICLATQLWNDGKRVTAGADIAGPRLGQLGAFLAKQETDLFDFVRSLIEEQASGKT